MRSFDSCRRITDTFPLPPSSLFQSHHLARTNNDTSTISAHHLSGYSNLTLKRASPLEFLVHTPVAISGFRTAASVPALRLLPRHNSLMLGARESATVCKVHTECILSSNLSPWEKKTSLRFLARLRSI